MFLASQSLLCHPRGYGFLSKAREQRLSEIRYIQSTPLHDERAYVHTTRLDGRIRHAIQDQTTPCLSLKPPILAPSVSFLFNNIYFSVRCSTLCPQVFPFDATGDFRSNARKWRHRTLPSLRNIVDIESNKGGDRFSKKLTN